MSRLIAVIFVASLFLLSRTNACAQNVGQPKQKKLEDENARMVKLIEKSYKQGETERDRVVKELSRLEPQRDLTADFGNWFARVARGSSSWERAHLSNMGIAEIFDRMAGRLNVQNSITRSQFIAYARQYWSDHSPPWKAPKEWDAVTEADKLFKRLDADRDGYLTGMEIPEALGSELRRWDRNGDGAISFEEYRAYFPHRLQRIHRELMRETRGLPPPEPEPPIPDYDTRPTVIRAGKLPAGLPAWFDAVDLDHDGQIALHEWRRAGWPLDEFAKLDLNDDGLLVPQEVLKLLARTERDGSHPYAYLMKKELPKAR